MHLSLSYVDANLRRLLPFTLLLFFAVWPSFAVVVPLNVLPQEAGESPTPAAAPPDAYIQVTYDDQISVRSGPNSHIYDRIGGLFPGETAPALGQSTGGWWIQIRYPATGAIGWVFAANVRVVSSAPLPPVQAPPTPTLSVTATINPTVAAALMLTPVPPTRIATYTPPNPLQIPTYTPAATTEASIGPISFGLVIVLLTLFGGLGVLISFLRGRS